MAAMRVAAVLLVLVLVACGGGGSGEADGDATAAPTAGAGTPTEAAASEAPAPPVGVQGVSRVRGIEDLSDQSGKVKLRLVMGEEQGTFFKPNFVKVAPGTNLQLTVDNAGGADHNFSIESQKIDFDLAPGKARDVEVAMPKQDALRFFCNIHPDMAGAFYSEEGQEVQR